MTWEELKEGTQESANVVTCEETPRPTSKQLERKQFEERSHKK